MTSPVMTGSTISTLETDDWPQKSLSFDSHDAMESETQQTSSQRATDSTTPISKDGKNDTAGYYITPVDTLDLRKRPQNYSIVFLRERLRERGLTTSGSKNVLIERLILNH